LPRSLSAPTSSGDFHAHTTSTDAHSTLAENRAMAAELGYEYLGVSDHADDLRMVGGFPSELEEQWAEVDALNADGSGACPTS
jgi:DNA polymerase (family X)